MKLTKNIEIATNYEELHQYGTRCYQKGYRRANLEWLIAFGGLALVTWGMGKLIERSFDRKEPENEPNSEEEAE